MRGDNVDLALRDLTVSELHPAALAQGAPVLSPTVAPVPPDADGAETPTKGSDPFVTFLDAVVLSRSWLRGRALRVRVTPGAGARSVTLHLDGRRVAVDRRAPFVLRYRPPAGLRPGVHRLQAIAGDGSRSRTLRVRYRR